MQTATMTWSSQPFFERAGALDDRHATSQIAPTTIESVARMRCARGSMDRASFLPRRASNDVSAAIATNVTLVAKPSRPSVRFTAFDDPSRMKMIKNKYRAGGIVLTPLGSAVSLKNGILRFHE